MKRSSSPPPSFYRDLALLLGGGASLKESLGQMALKSEDSRVRYHADVLLSNAEGQTGYSLRESQTKLNFIAKELLSSEAEPSVAIPVLFSIADDLEKEKTLRRRLSVALAYPASILAFYFIMLFAAQSLILPAFQEMFDGFGAELPIITRLILDAPNFFPIALAVLIIFAVKPFREAIAKRLPIFASIYKTTETMKMARATILLRKFISDNDAALFLALSRFGASKGEDLGEFVSQKKLFSPLEWQAIRNEKNSAAPLLLEEFIDALDARYRNLIERAAVISQLTSMILIASLVGSLTIGVMAPIFQLSSVVS